MKVGQKKWTENTGWTDLVKGPDSKAHLILIFGERSILAKDSYLQELKKLYPGASLVILSTAGNIQGVHLDDRSMIATLLQFEKDSRVEVKNTHIENVDKSLSAGAYLGKALKKEGLKHVLLFSDGHLVNGSDLLKGMLAELPLHVAITGGLAGDGTHFQETVVGYNETPKPGNIVAIGFYGEHLKFGYGSEGGWDAFGTDRKITKAYKNRLYELDGKLALEIYKNYLGEHTKDLPGSALLFPLAVKQDKESSSVVRTILSIDPVDNAMVFAGNIPEGGYAQLMKANLPRLVAGAKRAAYEGAEMLDGSPVDLALLISCVGRRIVLDDRVEEELNAVKDVMNEGILAGFYSYGEIAPNRGKTKSPELHNQTMTITTLREE